jgi:hypothetical protein
MADRGAVSADLGGGLEGLLVPAPYSEGATSTAGLVPALTAGGRYAFRNWLELSLSGFFGLPLTYWHNGGTVQTSDGPVPGSLSHQLLSYGGAVGVRFAKGAELRLSVGCELGWIHRSYSQFTAWNDVNAASVAPYPLAPPLADVGLDNVVVAPLASVEWMAGDHWAVSLVPRVQVVLGREATVAVLVPLTFSWSWYL